MRLDADQDPELEIWAARRKGDLLESLTGRKLRLSVDAVGEQREVRSDDETVRGHAVATTPAGSGLHVVK
jgi:hypothetical protein